MYRRTNALLPGGAASRTHPYFAHQDLSALASLSKASGSGYRTVPPGSMSSPSSAHAWTSPCRRGFALADALSRLFSTVRRWSKTSEVSSPEPLPSVSTSCWMPAACAWRKTWQVWWSAAWYWEPAEGTCARHPGTPPRRALPPAPGLRARWASPSLLRGLDVGNPPQPPGS